MSKTTTETHVEKLYELFGEYKSAYAAEWERLDECERMYRGDHWRNVPEQNANEPRPITPVIQSTIESVRADLMDQKPEAIIIADDPRYESVAAMLTEIVRENHRRCRFDREYGAMLHDLLVGGYMVQEIGFDPDDNDGLGGAFVRQVDNHAIMFDPLCADIQSSRAIFKFAPYSRDWFKQHYPKVADELEEDGFSVIRAQDDFLNDRAASATGENSLLLIECWQREYDSETRRHSVHMTVMAGKKILETSRKFKPEGYYSHGKYPFIVTPLFTRKGTPLGFGFVDMFKQAQKYSDKLDQIVLKNALMASRNKLLVTHASGFDVNDLRDWSKEVHKGENLNGVTWFPTAPLPGYILAYIENMRKGIKEESGSNDFSRGQTYGGVTAASAIAALQEASSKRSRMVARDVHGAFEEAVRQEIEIEREFSEFPRLVSLRGHAFANGAPREDGAEDNAKGLFSARLMFEVTGLKNRLPLEFVVTVKAQRENRFSLAAHNELMIKLVQLRMISPDIGLEMMLFDGKQQAQAMMAKKAREVQQAQQGQMPMPEQMAMGMG